MTATLRKLFSAVLAAALAAALLPAAAFASVTAAATDDLARQAITLDPKDTHFLPTESHDIDVTLSFEGPIRCGEPVLFTINASGLNNRFLYQPYSLYIKDSYADADRVQDFSYSRLVADNTFEVTFDYSGSFDLRVNVTDKDDLTVFTRPTFTLTVDDPNAPHHDDIPGMLNDRIEAAYAGCLAAGCKTEYDKALWLHDWLIDNVSYDYSMHHCRAVDALLFDTGTCEAYHAAYMALLNRAGIACGRVSSSGHVWTSVRIDGKWCHVDTTHDDVDKDWYKLGSMSRHFLFGLDDAAMADYLAVNKGSIVVRQPSFESVGLDNSFAIRSGEVYRYSEGFAGAIQENLDRGSTSFQLPIPENNWPENYRIALYRPVSYQLSGLSWTAAGKPVSVAASYRAGSISFTATPRAEAANPASPSETAKPATKKASLSKAKVTGLVSKAYTGKRITQKPTVKLAGKTLKLNRDYKLHFANNIKRGTAIVTVKGTGAYTGSKKASFKIMKYKQPMKCSLKAKAKTLRASKVSKAPVSIPKPFTVKKAKGKVSFANVSTQKTAKAFKVNPRTGTVTVPKMTKKGTYLLKVRIQAAGSSPYAYGSRNLALKVQIR